MTGRFLVWEVGNDRYVVLSLDSTSGKPKQYYVAFNGYRWMCNCPHYLKHCEDVNFTCKHIQAVMLQIGKPVELRKSQSGNNGHKAEEEKPLLIEKTNREEGKAVLGRIVSDFFLFSKRL